jgi:hypothetical protein
MPPNCIVVLGLFLLARRWMHGPLPYWRITLSSRNEHCGPSGQWRLQIPAEIPRRAEPFPLGEQGMLPTSGGPRSDSWATQ